MKKAISFDEALKDDRGLDVFGGPWEYEDLSILREGYPEILEPRFRAQLDMWTSPTFGYFNRLGIRSDELRDPKKCENDKLPPQWIKGRCPLCGQRFKRVCNIWHNSFWGKVMCWRCAVFWKPEKIDVKPVFYCFSCAGDSLTLN